MQDFDKTKLKDVPKLYETDGKRNKSAYLHFYNLLGQGDWYVCEAEEQEDGNVLFFGYVKFLFNEWGYFTLHELQSVPSIVWDTGFKKTRVASLCD